MIAMCFDMVNAQADAQQDRNRNVKGNAGKYGDRWYEQSGLKIREPLNLHKRGISATPQAGFQHRPPHISINIEQHAMC